LDIVYEDDNILVANKPSGIEILDDTENNLTKLIQNHYNLNNNFPYPCHRLDRNTSGLILYAKNKESLDILNEKIEKHELLKFYKCTVIGILKKKETTLTDYLFKDSKKSMVYISSIPKQGYKKIITSYKVIKEDTTNNLSILEVQLHTGRTHQIRAHLAYISHPLLR
ncbi:MAG: RluA family pseudouridine synthase, partial [Clostridiales bacterium]|nr:RluA family pseudouridine synthase [Clostridiales bacterium]